MSKLRESLLALASIIMAIPASTVFGQYAQDPDFLLKRCADLGIDPSSCTVQEIMKKTPVCIPEKCGNEPVQPGFIIFPILIGSGIALAVGIVAVRAISDTKQQTKA